METNREKEPNPIIKEYYPYVTRSLMRLYNEGRLSNVDSLYVEPDYGYVARIGYNDGSFRVTYGNDLGLNTGSSEDLAKDKGYTKALLREIDVEVPLGREFVLPSWFDTIRGKYESKGFEAIQTTDEAPDFIDSELHYPVYIKPVSGSKGGDVYRIENHAELDEIVALYDEKKVRVAVIEQAINMPDYRLVVLDGRLISAYQRVPLAVVGNGIDQTSTLIDKLQAQYIKEGRDTLLDSADPRILRHLGQKSLNLDYVPKFDEVLTLASISNLSAGGTSVDVTSLIDQKWIDLAARIANNFNLRLSGIDLACTDITDGNSPYAVLEVNSSPGLDHYAMSGDAQRQIVDDLYTEVLNTPNSYGR